jgi:hypothetical protein
MEMKVADVALATALAIMVLPDGEINSVSR